MNALTLIFCLSLISLNSCFGPFDPHNPPPAQGDTTSIKTTTKGLIAYWKCNDPAGSTVLKDSLGKNNGMIFGAVTDSGVDSTGLRFSGTDDYAVVEIPEKSALNFGTDDFTISLWIKPQIYKTITDSTRFDIISSGITKESGFTISIYRKSFGAYIGQFKNDSYDSTFDASENKWRHIVLVRKNSTVELYVNASKVQSYTNDNDISTKGVLKIIIADDASTRKDNEFPGIIDEIKIFTTSWDIAKIRSDYNQFK